MWKPVVVALLVLMTTSVSWSADETPREIIVQRDIAYREGPSKTWRLDLAMPKDRGDSPRPVIVVIHGGGWLEGDKSSFVFTDRKAPANIVDFARQGFVAVSINYRVSREAVFPAALQDCQCAVRWLRAHARDYHIDPQRIGAYGNSAGGHLALMLGLVETDVNQTEEAPFPQESSLVQAVASDSGPVDLITQAKDSQIHGVVKQFLGGPAEGDLLASYRAASPSHQINAKAAPMLLIYGVSDLQIPIVTIDEFVLALGKAGVEDVTYHRLAYVDHCPHSLVAIPELQQVIDQFFQRTLMHPESAREVKRWKR